MRRQFRLDSNKIQRVFLFTPYIFENELTHENKLQFYLQNMFLFCLQMRRRSRMKTLKILRLFAQGKVLMNVDERIWGIF